MRERDRKLLVLERERERERESEWPKVIKQRDGIYSVLIIYRNIWSLVSLVHFMTFTMLRFFHRLTTS